MHSLEKRKGASFPVKMQMYRLIKDYGAESILGRPLIPQEAREMQLANRIESAYYAKYAATNEAAWANADPGGFELLRWAGKVANGTNS
jgi:hypothetical protein